MTDASCGACMFWKEWKKSEGRETVWGNCHRMPPSYVEEYKNMKCGRWPATHAENWCGEFKAKAQEDVPF